MKKISSLSIFFPTYNDAKILSYLISKADRVASLIADDYEILIINDGSKDDTKETLMPLEKVYPKLRILNHNYNRGYGAALISGFKNSRYEWVFYTDGDGQYDPSEIIKLTEKISVHVDVVNGYKIKRGDNIIRRFIGYINNTILHIVFPLPISDIDCDFRLIRKSELKKFDLKSTSGTICTELIMRLKLVGARFEEIGVSHYSRPFGKSQFFTFTNIFRTVRDNIRLYKEIHSSL